MEKYLLEKSRLVYQEHNERYVYLITQPTTTPLETRLRRHEFACFPRVFLQVLRSPPYLITHVGSSYSVGIHLMERGGKSISTLS